VSVKPARSQHKVASSPIPLGYSTASKVIGGRSKQEQQQQSTLPPLPLMLCTQAATMIKENNKKATKWALVKAAGQEKDCCQERCQEACTMWGCATMPMIGEGPHKAHPLTAALELNEAMSKKGFSAGKKLTPNKLDLLHHSFGSKSSVQCVTLWRLAMSDVLLMIHLLPFTATNSMFAEGCMQH